MRVEPYSVGSFVHVIKRGARGLPITKDESDRRRFARLLFYVNDEYKDEKWDRATHARDMFARPSGWPERRALCKVHCWTLMPNHFHLLLEETQEGGIAKYMQRLCGSMSAHFNARHGERGSIFQGGYKSRTILDDSYLRQVILYIAVKNVFELYPGGLARAVENFQDAWEWGKHRYVYSSLPELTGVRGWPITAEGIVRDMFTTQNRLMEHAKEMLLSRSDMSEIARMLDADDP